MKSKDKIILEKIQNYIKDIYDFINGYNKKDFDNDKKDDVKVQSPQVKEVEKKGDNSLDVFDFDLKEETPVVSQVDDEDTYDLQKELEAKFDELFGAVDED